MPRPNDASSEKNAPSSAQSALPLVAESVDTAGAPATAPMAGAEPASYELALAELDQIVSRIEAGQLPLDQLLDGYRRGADLLAWCRMRLSVVEAQVKVLENGQLDAWPAK